jgi:hypothetical protein
MLGAAFAAVARRLRDTPQVPRNRRAAGARQNRDRLTRPKG